jgi:eukaryotic-like serine/threonine-protein kinase
VKNKYYFLLLSFLLCSCSSITFRQGISIDENSDWLQIGRNEEKTNLADTSVVLNPPFSELWHFNAESAFAKDCMSASDGVLFTGCLDGNVQAVNVFNGSGLGKTNTKSKSCFSTPVILKNIIVLIFSDGLINNIVGYDFRTGEHKWIKKTEEIISSPAVKNNKIFYATVKGSICKINSDDGSKEWTYRNDYSVQNSPTISDDLLFVGDIKGNLIALDIKTGKMKWNFKTNGGIYSDVSVYKNRIFFGSDDNHFYCLDSNGILLWKKNLETKFLSSSSFYGDNVITAGVNGKIYSLNMASGDLVWEFATRGTISASPVVCKDKIFIGSYDKFFYCIDAAKGEMLWKYDLEDRIRTTAVIWKNFIIVANDDKSIYCFK